jgi:hypothetical protein
LREIVDKNEAELRLRGADDLARLMLNMMEQMGIMSGKKMTDIDRTNLQEILISLRKLLEERYSKKMNFLNSIK